MFLANTRQNEKLNFTLDFKHSFFSAKFVARFKKNQPKKKKDVSALGGTFVCVTLRVPRGALASIFPLTVLDSRDNSAEWEGLFVI